MTIELNASNYKLPDSVKEEANAHTAHLFKMRCFGFSSVFSAIHYFRKKNNEWKMLKKQKKKETKVVYDVLKKG